MVVKQNVMETVHRFKDEYSAQFGTFINSSRQMAGQLNVSDSRAEGFNTTLERASGTAKEFGNRLKLLGLIGLGTFAALFANTPILQAAFALLKAEITPLFLIMQGKILPVFQFFAAQIRKIREFLQANPFVKNLVQDFTALLIGLAVVAVAVSAFVKPFFFLANFVIGLGTKLAGPFKTLLSFIRPGITLIKSLAGGLSVGLVAAFAVVLIALKGLFENWDNIWEDIKGILSGFETFFSGVMDIIVGIFTGDTDLILEGWDKMWDGLLKIAKSFGALILDVIGGIFSGFEDVVSSVSELLGFGALGENERLSNLFKGAASGLRGGGGEFQDFISRPGQAPIPFSSDDTIIGTKGGGMGTGDINITLENVSIAGFDDIREVARDMAIELRRELPELNR